MLKLIYTVLSGLPFLVCLFWSVMLFFRFEQAHRSKKILAAFMLVATVLYFGHFCVFNRIWSLIPLTDTLYTFSTLSVYPIYSIYLKGLTGHVDRRQLFLLLPAGVVATVVGISYAFLPADLERELLEVCHFTGQEYPPHWTCQWSRYAHEVMKPLIVLQVLYTAIVGFHHLNTFKKRVERCYSNTEHRDLSETRSLLILLLCTSVLSVIADLLGRSFFLNSLTLWALPMVAFALMLFSIGFVGYRQQFTIDDLRAEEMLSVRQTNCLDTRRQLRKRLDSLMEEEQLYLKYDLKISDVAACLATNRTYIQEALKTEGDDNVSFSDYVNRYRISHSISLLSAEMPLSMNEIIIRSGYQSRATFYRNFKKMTGKSPEQFLNEK